MTAKKKAKRKRSKAERVARDQWTKLNVLGLRLFEARGGVIAALNHCKREDLDHGRLEEVLHILEEEAQHAKARKDELVQVIQEEEAKG